MKVLSASEDAADPDMNPLDELSLTIMKTTTSSGQQIGFVFSTALSVFENHFIPQRNIFAPVLLWRHAYLDTSSLDARDSIEETVGDLVDGFLNEWLKAKG
jgi:hypothetical protein